MISRNFKAIAVSATAALFLASCGAAEQEQSSMEDSGQMSEASGMQSGASTMMESSMMEDSGMSGMESTMMGGEVTVGGFMVETPDGEEVSVPEVAVSPDDAEAYIEDVRPIVKNSVRDISGLVEPEVSLENGNIGLDLNVNSLDEARQSIEDGADDLRELQPPGGLETVNDQLIQAYEDAVPAYQNVVDAAEGGDPQEITDVVQQSLGDIERFNSEVDALLQDVQQAANDQQ